MECREKARLLVVDDEPVMVDLLVCMLESDYQVEVVGDGESALKLARRGGIDLILLDLVLPVIGGFEVCRALKDDPRTARVPVIFITGEHGARVESLGFRFGGADYITKPFSPGVVKARVARQLAISRGESELERQVRQRTRQIEKESLEIVRQLGRVSELREGDSGEHVALVAQYAYHIAREAGLTEEDAELIRTVAPLHDLGKIAVPEQILLKPGPLDPDEWDVIHTHCEIGYRIIGEHQTPLLRTAAQCAYSHHERWDGRGYPQGLSGEKIPFAARILAVADVFDALTRDRPYKKAWPVDAAVAEMVQCAGGQFDPFVVDAFLCALPKIVMEMRDPEPCVGTGRQNFL